MHYEPHESRAMDDRERTDALWEVHLHPQNADILGTIVGEDAFVNDG
jgi:hypothetical protein